jgi:hypothetical protein
VRERERERERDCAETLTITGGTIKMLMGKKISKLRN